MHKLLIDYAVEGLSYIDKYQLIQALKRADNSYYIDDLNFLTQASNIDCLCGYFSGTDYTRNFSYVRLINKNWQTNPTSIDIDFRTLGRVFISCRDFNVLEQFFDFYYENRLFRSLCLNTPIIFDDVGKPAEEVLPEILAKYSGYYTLSSQIYDYRFQDLKNIFSNEDDSLYVIESSLQDLLSDEVPVYDDWYVVKKYGKPVFAYGCSLNYHPERIGTKCFSFDNSFYKYVNETIQTEDVLSIWTYLAKKYISDGYVVKGIAINEGFDSDEMYVRLGMEKYRCFFRLITDNVKDK